LQADAESIDCENTMTCWVVGNQWIDSGFEDIGFAAVTTDGGQTWQNAAVPINSSAQPAAEGPFSDLDDVTCPSLTSCLAFGLYPGAGGIRTAVVQFQLVGGAPQATVLAQLPAGWTPDGEQLAAETETSTAGNNNALLCLSAQRCLAAGHSGQNGEVLETDDGGTSWLAVPGRHERGGINAVSCPSVSRCVAVTNSESTQKARVIATSDGGQTWSGQSSPNTVALLSTITCVDAQHCIAVGAGRASNGTSGPGTIIFSIDGGRVWQPADIPTLPLGNTVKGGSNGQA
jgi:photosystem II stability/assembly factor-like uncharacterized protein